MNGFEVIHGWNATDHTVLLVYNTSMGMKIFTFWLPGWCVISYYDPNLKEGLSCDKVISAK